MNAQFVTINGFCFWAAPFFFFSFGMSTLLAEPSPLLDFRGVFPHYSNNSLKAPFLFEAFLSLKVELHRSRVGIIRAVYCSQQFTCIGWIHK